MPKLVVVLSDGETYSDLEGCKLLEVPDDVPPDEEDVWVERSSATCGKELGPLISDNTPPRYATVVRGVGMRVLDQLDGVDPCKVSEQLPVLQSLAVRYLEDAVSAGRLSPYRNAAESARCGAVSAAEVHMEKDGDWVILDLYYYDEQRVRQVYRLHRYIA